MCLESAFPKKENTQKTIINSGSEVVFVLFDRLDKRPVKILLKRHKKQFQSENMCFVVCVLFFLTS